MTQSLKSQIGNKRVIYRVELSFVDNIVTKSSLRLIPVLIALISALDVKIQLCLQGRKTL
jgi:hypothetical protein